MKHKIAGALAIALFPWWVPLPAWASDPGHDIDHDCVDYWHVCGPFNPEGKPAACYDEGGVIIAEWPCLPVDLGDGRWDAETNDPQSQY